LNFKGFYPGIICFIGVGSNQNNPIARCLEAVKLMMAIEGLRFVRRSSLYLTEPIGITDQEWFINTVCEIKTRLSPYELLIKMKEIESNMGRKRTVKWGPRIIDLDILFYGQEVIDDEELTIPHRELHKRRFVLEPLNEIAPYMIHPAFGISIRGLLDRLEDTAQVKVLKEG